MGLLGPSAQYGQDGIKVETDGLPGNPDRRDAARLGPRKDGGRFYIEAFGDLFCTQSFTHSGAPDHQGGRGLTGGQPVLGRSTRNGGRVDTA